MVRFIPRTYVCIPQKRIPLFGHVIFFNVLSRDFHWYSFVIAAAVIARYQRRWSSLLVSSLETTTQRIRLLFYPR